VYKRHHGTGAPRADSRRQARDGGGGVCDGSNGVMPHPEGRESQGAGSEMEIVSHGVRHGGTSLLIGRRKVNLSLM